MNNQDLILLFGGFEHEDFTTNHNLEHMMDFLCARWSAEEIGYFDRIRHAHYSEGGSTIPSLGATQEAIRRFIMALGKESSK